MPNVSVSVTDGSGQTSVTSVNYTVVAPSTRPALLVPGYAVEKFYDDFKTFDTTKWTKNTGPLGAPREEYNRAENVTIGPDGLQITAKREAFGGKQITSGYVTSSGKAAFGPYAHFEAEITMPKMSPPDSAGLWPAWWLRYDTLPGEVDILEAYGRPFTAARTAAETLVMTESYDTTTHGNTNGNLGRLNAQPPTGSVKDLTRHRYGVTIDEWGVTYFLDGKAFVDKYGRNGMSWETLAARPNGGVPKANFMAAAHMRLQLQVGSSYWGPSNAQTALPATMKVHWVRVLTKT